MKYFVPSVIIIGIIHLATFSYVTGHNRMERTYRPPIQTSSVFKIRGASSVLRSVQGGETSCDSEVQVLDSNPNLISSLDQLLTDLDNSVAEHYDKYCKVTLSEVGVLIQCALDYSDYSSEYLSLCSENDGVAVSVRFLAMCQTDNMELEMEYSNLPYCFGKSCSRDNINNTVSAFLNGVESAWSQDNNSMACSIIYDSDFEQTISIVSNVENDETTESIILNDSNSSNKNQGTVLHLALMLLGGMLLL